MNDDKMDTLDEDPADPRPCDPLSEEDPALAATKGACDLASSDGGSHEPPASTPAEDPGIPANPLPDPDPDPAPDPAADAQAGLEQLRGELTRLRAELSQKDRLWERLGAECEEFGALYPDTPLSSLPDPVWKDVARGIPLAAAYALAEKRRLYTEALAQKSNRENQARSSGALNTADADYFTPGEVRAMSADEVRTNYQKIMLSMQKWH